MSIISFDPVHASEVARLHRESISTGFLSTLPQRFLARLYSAIASAPGSCVYVAEGRSTEPARLAGFIAGTLDTRAMYRHVLRKHWLSYSLLLLPRAFSPRTAAGIWQTMRYGRSSTQLSSDTDQPRQATAELLSVAIAPGVRGKGVGRALVRQLEDFYLATVGASTSQHPFAYKVVTLASDSVANFFYRGCGFQHARQFRHHGNLMNEYVKTVTGQ